MNGYCENGRMAGKRKTSAANYFFSSLLNLAPAPGGSLGALSAPASPADSNTELARAAGKQGYSGKRQGSADSGERFLSPPHKLSHSQSVRSKQGGNSVDFFLARKWSRKAAPKVARDGI